MYVGTMHEDEALKLYNKYSEMNSLTNSRYLKALWQHLAFESTYIILFS